jgi:hypothetical protein
MKLRLVAAGIILTALLGVLLVSRTIAPDNYTQTTLATVTQAAYQVYGDLAEYQIVYVVASDTERSQHDVLATLPDITQAKVAHNWQAVLNFQAEKPIEAIIIDRSAYPWVDKRWTAAIARQGLVIATINMYAQEHTELRDRDCERQKTAKKSPFEEDYFLVSVHLIQTEDPAKLDQAIETSYSTCKLMKSTSRIFETSNGTHSPLRTSDDVRYLTNSIIGDITMIRDAKASLTALSSPPTIVPEFAQ